MRRAGRLRASPLVVLVALCAAGCASWSDTGSTDPAARAQPALFSEDGVQIDAYMTADGVRHEYHGHVRLAGDLYVFIPDDHSNGPFKLPRSEVTVLLHGGRQPDAVVLGLALLAFVLPSLLIFAALVH